MTRLDHWTLPGAAGQPIVGTTHVPAGEREAKGVLLVAHGFKGYKDYGFLPHLAEAAAAAGFVAHRFNFSHSGMAPRGDRFERADLFERDTWGKQVFDLHAVARAAREGRIAGSGLPQVWFGHSRGGVTAILAAGLAGAEAPELEPRGVVTAAAPHTADRLDDEQKRLLRKLGRLESPSSRTGEMLHIGREWLDELEADPARFNPMAHAERLRTPLLILHGDNDGTVHAMSGRLLHKATRERSQLVTIRGATHTFNASHPLPLDQPPPNETQRLIRETLAFAARVIDR